MVNSPVSLSRIVIQNGGRVTLVGLVSDTTITLATGAGITINAGSSNCTFSIFHPYTSHIHPSLIILSNFWSFGASRIPH